MPTWKRADPEVEFKLDKGRVPIPPRNANRTKYPFADLQVTQSFTVPITLLSNVQKAAYHFTTKNPEYKFTVRRMKEGNAEVCRCWRVA